MARGSLRIVRLLPFFAPAWRFGGPVVQAAATSRALAARGHHVRVVTSDLGLPGELPRGRWTALDGYQVFHAPTRPWHRAPPYPLPAAAPALREALEDADLLLLNVGLTLANELARRAARSAGVAYVYNAEGALCPHRLRTKRAGKWLFLRLFERRILRDAAALQAVTAAEAGQLAAQGADPRRVHVVPNGVDPGPPEAWPEGGVFRQRFGLDMEARIVLFLGRLHRVKGLDLLVRAAAACAPRHPRMLLVVAGPDEDGSGRRAAALASRLGVEDRVVFTGPLEGGLRAAAFRAADLFALTSLSEGLPVACLEALAFGVPLLVTDRCNLPEAAAWGAGRVVPPDPGAAAAALDAMLSDPEALRLAGLKARSLARERFALDRVVDRLEALYVSVARPR